MLCVLTVASAGFAGTSRTVMMELLVLPEIIAVFLGLVCAVLTRTLRVLVRRRGGAGAWRAAGAASQGPCPTSKSGSPQTGLHRSNTPGIPREWQLAAVPPAQRRQPRQQPVIDICGGGMYFYWKAGVLKFLQTQHDLSGCRLRGASAGALVAIFAACDVDLGRVVQRANELMLERGVWRRLLGVAGVWGPMARQCLEELLPEDAHTRCSGRVQVCITQLPSLRPLCLEHFQSKADVIDACMASVHIPFFLDGRPAASVRGSLAVDGVIGCWLASKLAALLQLPDRVAAWALGASGKSSSSSSGSGGSGGSSTGPSAAGSRGAGKDALRQQKQVQRQQQQQQQAQPAASQQRFDLFPGGRHSGVGFAVDYTLDNKLPPCMFGSVRLRSLEQIEGLVQCGFEYGRRMQEQGKLRL